MASLQPQPGNSPPPSALNFIEPRMMRRTTRARAQRHRHRVVWLRWFLPLAALGVLATLIIWPILKPEKIARAVMKNIPDLVIKDLHFTGLDSKNQPYSLNAVKATRPSGMQNIYDLDKPEGEMTMTNGTWIDGRSLYGRYEQDSRRLWLGGDVHMFQDKGYEFTTDEAQVNLNDHYAWGEKPVLIQGQFGEIRGQGFRLLDGGHTMIVTGPAHAVLNLHGGQSGQGSGKSATPPQ